MTLTEKEKQEIQKEIDNTWKIINFTIRGIIYLIFIIFLYLTIKYSIIGLLYGFT